MSEGGPEDRPQLAVCAAPSYIGWWNKPTPWGGAQTAATGPATGRHATSF
jgi:hypothetical protein